MGFREKLKSKNPLVSSGPFVDLKDFLENNLESCLAIDRFDYSNV